MTPPENFPNYSSFLAYKKRGIHLATAIVIPTTDRRSEHSERFPRRPIRASLTENCICLRPVIAGPRESNLWIIHKQRNLFRRGRRPRRPESIIFSLKKRVFTVKAGRRGRRPLRKSVQFHGSWIDVLRTQPAIFKL